MQAVVYEKPWQMRMAELPDPEPGSGEVLLEVQSVGICGSDVHGFTGESGRRAPGMVMGHEVSATVVAHGPGTTGPPLGSRVAVYNIIGERAPTPEEGDPSFMRKMMIGVNLGTRGAFAERIAVPQANAIPLDDAVPTAVGLLAEPLAVAGHAWDRLEGHARATPERIAILGSGTIGLASVLVTRHRLPGPRPPAVLDIVAAKAERAASFGATAVVGDAETPPEAAAQQLVQALEGQPQVVVDAVGSEQSFRTATAAVADGGCILIIGNLAHEVPLPLQSATSYEWTLIGCYGFNLDSFTAAVQLLPHYRDELSSFIGHTCTLEEIPETITAMAKGELQALKVAVEVGAARR